MMTQPIDRETAIALAKEVWCCDIQSLGTANLEVFANLAVSHSRKDAEPVGEVITYLRESCGGRNGVEIVDAALYEPVTLAVGTKLFTHPPEADKPNPLEDLDCAKMMVRSAGYSLVSADFINSFAEFIQDWQKGDFDLPKLAALDVKACFDAWQADVNQAEVKTTKNTEPNTNGTDYVSDREFDALIAELQSITEEARATDYHDTLRKAALFLNLLKSKVHKYANDIVRLDAACTEQHAAYTSAHNRLNEADKLLQQALVAIEEYPEYFRYTKAERVMKLIRTYLEGKK